MPSSLSTLASLWFTVLVCSGSGVASASEDVTERWGIQTNNRNLASELKKKSYDDYRDHDYIPECKPDSCVPPGKVGMLSTFEAKVLLKGMARYDAYPNFNIQRLEEAVMHVYEDLYSCDAGVDWDLASVEIIPDVFGTLEAESEDDDDDYYYHYRRHALEENFGEEDTASRRMTYNDNDPIYPLQLGGQAYL